MAELSPMMKQYMEIKGQHNDHILFFRLGDFYEMFFDDAILASRELELTLTGRDCGQEERAPMCGIPYHSCEAYIARLIEKGYKVAICEQVEDPALAKGIVKRDVIRVITPGTVIEGSMLDESKNNYLACVCIIDNMAGVLFSDVSTGEIHLTEFSQDGDVTSRVINELGRFAPSEVLITQNATEMPALYEFIKVRLNCSVTVLEEFQTEYNNTKVGVLSHFGKGRLSELGLEGKTVSVQTLGAFLDYLYSTQKTGLSRLTSLNLYMDDQYMNLDITARRNLELTETMRNGEKRGSLLWVLDKTQTAMGKRLIRKYIEQPLLNPASIIKRYNAVDELSSDNIIRSNLMEILSGVFDLERLMTRIIYGSANPREVKALAYTAEKLPLLKQRLSGMNTALLKELYNLIDPLEDICNLIQNAIQDDPPVTVKEGGIIKQGYNEELDKVRDVLINGKSYIAQIEANEKSVTGIKNLRIGYNRVFGYYIEVTKSNIDMVPDSYIRKQTLANCERYITQELKDLEARVLSANEQTISLELELFDEVRKAIAGQLHRIQNTARAIATLDVICSFSQVATNNRYVRPDLNLTGEIIIKEGRHPVVEAMLDVPFVPNDTYLDNKENAVAIITGPNMAGKSTYMRQVALISLMAQIGSFVPAQSANLAIVDSIFTRVGASDDLASGQSTFMVEMNEVSHILKNATANSLLILDEIGRGTSTFDGMSIARAVVEYIANKKKLGAKALFATHYHELTELEEQLENVKNYNIVVKKRGDNITFLRRIVRGGADDSYGIEVAKLAGISDEIISRAKEILKALEAGEPVSVRRGVKKKQEEIQEEYQISFTTANDLSVIDKIRSIDVDVLTPREAINILFELRRMVDE